MIKGHLMLKSSSLLSLDDMLPHVNHDNPDSSWNSKRPGLMGEGEGRGLTPQPNHSLRHACEKDGKVMLL